MDNLLRKWVKNLSVALVVSSLIVGCESIETPSPKMNDGKWSQEVLKFYARDVAGLVTVNVCFKKFEEYLRRVTNADFGAFYSVSNEPYSYRGACGIAFRRTLDEAKTEAKRICDEGIYKPNKRIKCVPLAIDLEIVWPEPLFHCIGNNPKDFHLLPRDCRWGTASRMPKNEYLMRIAKKIEADHNNTQ